MFKHIGTRAMGIARNLTTKVEFKSGAEITVVKKVSQADVDDFSRLSGDTNPIHSVHTPENERMVHGALLNGFVSGVIGTKLPGPGTIVVSQQFTFTEKCKVNKDIEINVKLLDNRKIMKVAYECRQDGVVVLKGDAKLIRMKGYDSK